MDFGLYIISIFQTSFMFLLIFSFSVAFKVKKLCAVVQGIGSNHACACLLPRLDERLKSKSLPQNSLDATKEYALLT